ncbi:MAG: type II and III secretion system protein family protein, partial [Planctomycetia bacterium]
MRYGGTMNGRAAVRRALLLTGGALLASACLAGPTCGADAPAPDVVEASPLLKASTLSVSTPNSSTGAPAQSQPTDAAAKKERFVAGFVDPEATLELFVGRTRILALKKTPKRIQIADDKIAGYTVVSPQEVLVQGSTQGVTILNLWFAAEGPAGAEGKEETLSYLVRVDADPDLEERSQRLLKVLEAELRGAFPESAVELKLVGGRLTIAGQAKDPREAGKIVQMVEAGNPAGPVVDLLRVPVERQVMLKVTVAEVNRAAARSIGVRFGGGDAGLPSFGRRTGNRIVAETGGLAGNGVVNTTGVMDGRQARLALDALRKMNYAKSLAEPSLVALSGQTATFQSGGRFPVPVGEAGPDAKHPGVERPGVGFLPYGVQMRFTPFVAEDDRIRLSVQAEISARDLAAGRTNIGGALVAGVTTRNFETTVELREGQTLAVAGVVQTNLAAEGRRIPFLGELPLVGRFFSYSKTVAGEQELVVLITPTLVGGLDPCEAPNVLPGSDIVEPG